MANEHLPQIQQYILDTLSLESTDEIANIKSIKYIDHCIVPTLHDIGKFLGDNYQIEHSPTRATLNFATPRVSGNSFSVYVSADLSSITFDYYSESLFSDSVQMNIENPNIFNPQDVWLEFAKFLQKRVESFQELKN